MVDNKYIYGVTGSKVHEKIILYFQPLIDAAELVGNGNLLNSLKTLKDKLIKENVDSYRLLLNNIKIEEVNGPLKTVIKSKYGDKLI